MNGTAGHHQSADRGHPRPVPRDGPARGGGRQYGRRARPTGLPLTSTAAGSRWATGTARQRTVSACARRGATADRSADETAVDGALWGGFPADRRHADGRALDGRRTVRRQTAGGGLRRTDNGGRYRGSARQPGGGPRRSRAPVRPAQGTGSARGTGAVSSQVAWAPSTGRDGEVRVSQLCGRSKRTGSGRADSVPGFAATVPVAGGRTGSGRAGFPQYAAAKDWNPAHATRGSPAGQPDEGPAAGPGV